MIVIITASHVKNTMAYHMKNIMVLGSGGKMVNTTVPRYYQGTAMFIMVTMVTFYHDAVMHSSTVGYIVYCVAHYTTMCPAKRCHYSLILALTLPNANRVSIFDRH